ncbi:hypothetical protein MMC13_002843 [Lambiella insularis]|nr:hypothetical protein [Lambiella insularis]
MASVFTYDPDPPRVSSPWSTPPILASGLETAQAQLRFGGLPSPKPALLAECGITKLEAEPQEGPTEYKLHLLLRPRRSFSSLSTGHHISGSYQSRSKVPRSETGNLAKALTSPSIPAPTFLSRQNRLQHLTTQLLWRLQQSSPYHSSSTANLVVPVLPETTLQLGPPQRPGTLLPGLEESRGALYEIGVSDDGTLVGLTKDELDESLTNLRAMAASLGCQVEILRTVIVGDCEWSTAHTGPGGRRSQVNKDKLWVAEVRVAPDTHVFLQDRLFGTPLTNRKYPPAFYHNCSVTQVESESRTEQLCVSLTGSTTSGKSSLLGTLSTSTLDNGRGKSRLSLLKHRHEIASGMTSSVAPELIGYKPVPSILRADKREPSVVNYGCGNVSSWNDIHNTAEGGRLVFLIDSAGHPRYRRTTVRGLVSWAPHWTICCVAADDVGGSTGQSGSSASVQEVLGQAAAGLDLSKAHLDLCLKLELSIVVVITKYDLATKGGLRQTLAKVLSITKAAGRQPFLLTPCLHPGPDLNLQMLQVAYEDEVKAMFSTFGRETNIIVPIVITSAVTGSGIGKLHALLRQLPTPRPINLASISPTYYTEPNLLPGVLFHVDEIFTRADQGHNVPASNRESRIESTLVLSGHLRYGNLSTSDEAYIGPFPFESPTEDSSVEMYRARSYPGQTSGRPHGAHPPPTKRTPFSGDSSSLDLPTSSTSFPQSEWQRVRITSIRNFRLPVRKLLAGQVGTVGIEFCSTDATTPSKLRKGMVLARPSANVHGGLNACGGFRAVFDEGDYLAMEPGQLFSVYIASIRASAKIITVEAVADDSAQGSPADHEDFGNVFGFGELVADTAHVARSPMATEKRCIEVTFRFVSSREWVEVGTQVLVMPGSGAEGSVGLEGFVGRIAQALG